MLTLLFMACFDKSPAAIQQLDKTTSPPSDSPPTTVPQKSPQKNTVVLDGAVISVSWDDGDTFKAIHPQTGKTIKARLNGYNTLESYGPVHRWGEWTTKELYDLSQKAGVFAAKGGWTCNDTGKGGGYGRSLIDCPDLRREIIAAGLAHPFSMNGPAPEADTNALKQAIKNQAGMWAKGVPEKLMTSIHSNDERKDKDAYNRICSLENGHCTVETHQDNFEVCEEVCRYGSCMVYVPYKVRYGENKAACLK